MTGVQTCALPISTAKEIAQHFGDIDKIAAASMDELLAVPDVGEVIAKSVYDFFRVPQHIIEIQRLRADGLKLSMEAASKSLSAALAGKIIVISGNFSISRDEMKELIELHGGKNSSSLSGKTSFLLAGTKPGPEKMKKAEDLKIPVVSEDEFRKMLPEGSMPEDEVTEPDLFGGMVDD